MLSLKDIKKLQKKYKLYSKKRFGQNFLIDQSILKRIVDVADIKDKEVVEIGPGMGSLTRLLLENASKVIAYEIDKDMIRVLNGEIKKKNFKLINGNFLKQELNWKGQKTLVANLPYYISSDILFKVFYNIDKFDKAVIMLQDEVAERMIAKLGSKQYGKLTISSEYFATIKKEFIVKPKCFIPVPKVNSAIITLRFNKKQELDNKAFLEFVKKSFKQRRKTLFNNWKKIAGNVHAKKMLKHLRLNSQIRPQELTLNNFIEAFKYYNNLFPQI